MLVRLFTLKFFAEHMEQEKLYAAFVDVERARMLRVEKDALYMGRSKICGIRAKL